MAEGRNPKAQPSAPRPLLLALVGLLVIAIAVAAVGWGNLLAPSAPPVAVTSTGRAVGSGPALATGPPPTLHTTPPLPSPAAVPAPASQADAPAPASPTIAAALPTSRALAALAPSPPTPATAAPSFDIVRVDRSGHAVIAGRAPPGSEVAIAEAGRVIGKVEADPAGQFVFAPDQPLPAGARALTLDARLPTGSTVQGSEKVVVVVPKANTAEPVALLDSPTAPRLLQLPLPPTPGNVSSVGLDLLQYGQHGAITFAGHAPPAADLRVYLDDHAIGDARADAAGHWSLTFNGPLAAGMHQLRIDELSPTGKVLARIALPFERQELPAAELAAGNLVVVQPGQCLWLIAQHVYGTGVRYTLIFQANRDQIRNPALIYPGQIFTLPSRPEEGAARPAG